jgi:predicted metal-dependent phosphoesterase TrpH
LRLKVDLHLHTCDREPFIAYDGRGLIDRAAAAGFHVLSVTNHDVLTFSPALAAYAAARGILLIPGVEATIEGKHVLVYNLDVDPAAIRTFADLRRYRRPDWLVIAPHPFYPTCYSLGQRLIREIDLFDAIEFSHFYRPRLDFNRRAVRLAREVGLPLVGTSDSHMAAQFGTTYSLIDAEPTVDAVLAAIRKGQVSVVSRPLGLARFTRIVTGIALAEVRSRLAAARHAVLGPRATLGLGEELGETAA